MDGQADVRFQGHSSVDPRVRLIAAITGRQMSWEPKGE